MFLSIISSIFHIWYQNVFANVILFSLLFSKEWKKDTLFAQISMNFKHFKIVDPLHQYAIDYFFRVIKIPIDEFQLYYMPLYAAFGIEWFTGQL